MNTMTSNCLRPLIKLTKLNSAAHLKVPARTLLYSSKKGVSRNFIALLQQPIDLSPQSIKRWLKEKQLAGLKQQHVFVPKRHEKLGPDLATAHFIVARGGSVKFEGMERWVKKNKNQEYNLPKYYVDGMHVEAIDCSGGFTMYESLNNLVHLKKLKYLNMSNCQYIDDWCLDRFHLFSETLIYLDLSKCDNVTERGLACLHKLPNLRHLVVEDMVNVKHKPMMAILLEEMLPNTRVIGMDYLDAEDYHWEKVAEVPKFLEHLNSIEEKDKQTIVPKSQVSQM